MENGTKNKKKADHKYLMEEHNDTNDWEKGEKKNETIKRELNENKAGKRSTKRKFFLNQKMNWTSEMKFSLKKEPNLY